MREDNILKIKDLKAKVEVLHPKLWTIRPLIGSRVSEMRGGEGAFIVLS